MSFGPSNTTKTAENNLAGIAPVAYQNSTNELNAGQNLLNTGATTTASGTPAVQSGTNYFNTLLNGNAANTTAMLQPSIDQIRQGNQNQIQALSTLAPRGGGRSGTLFGASYAPQAQLSNLFNTGRTQAATALPAIGQSQQQLGLNQQNLGANLFGIANQPLNTVSGANTNLAQIGQQQQQMSNNLFGGIGGLLSSLALAPVTGGGSLIGGLGGLFGGGGGGVQGISPSLWGDIFPGG